MTVEAYMPEDGIDGSYSNHVNQLTRMGERVAALEVRADGLKEDTAHIRASVHEIKNEQQKAVAAEIACAKALGALEQHVATLTAQVAALMATHQQGTGAWRTLGRIGLFTVGAFTCLGAVVSSVILVAEHIR